MLRVKHGATLDQLSLCCSPSQARCTGPDAHRCAQTRIHKIELGKCLARLTAKAGRCQTRVQFRNQNPRGFAGPVCKQVSIAAQLNFSACVKTILQLHVINPHHDDLFLVFCLPLELFESYGGTCAYTSC